jgi:hypothetical protein
LESGGYALNQIGSSQLSRPWKYSPPEPDLFFRQEDDIATLVYGTDRIFGTFI